MALAAAFARASSGSNFCLTISLSVSASVSIVDVERVEGIGFGYLLHFDVMAAGYLRGRLCERMANKGKMFFAVVLS